jgi:hypothetical protein
MHSTHEAELDMPMLPAATKQVHIVPELATHTLLSIGQLCDAGCDVAFTAEEVTVKYKATQCSLVIAPVTHGCGISACHQTWQAPRK